MQAILFGKIKGGQVVLDNYNHVLESINKYEGKAVAIEIDPRGIRTLKQNKYLWGVVYKLLSIASGYTPEEVHQMFAGKFLAYQRRGQRFVRSTTDLKKLEFSEYTEKIKQYSSESEALGYLNIPDPDPKYWDK